MILFWDSCDHDSSLKNMMTEAHSNAIYVTCIIFKRGIVLTASVSSGNYFRKINYGSHLDRIYRTVRYIFYYGLQWTSVRTGNTINTGHSVQIW